MYKKLGVVIVLLMILVLGTSFTASAQKEREEIQSSTEADTDSAGNTEEVALGENAFIEEGNGTLKDTVTSADGKEFITVTTKKGNTFYLIIDHQRDSNNVYLLNKIDESDLQGFLDEKESIGGDSIVSLPLETESMKETTPKTEEESEGGKTADTLQNSLSKAGNGGNMNYLIILVVIGVFGVAYYFKIHKKKGQASYDEYETEEELEEDVDYEDDDADYERDDETEGVDDNNMEQKENEAKREAERKEKLEEERHARAEVERLRKERLKEEQESLKEEEKQLEEEKNRLNQEQKILAERQNKLKAQQKQMEDEGDIF